MFDPFWVRVEPYRIAVPPEGRVKVSAHIRNFLDRPQHYRIAIHCPAGIVAEPAILKASLQRRKRSKCRCEQYGRCQ